MVNYIRVRARSLLDELTRWGVWGEVAWAVNSGIGHTYY